MKDTFTVSDKCHQALVAERDSYIRKLAQNVKLMSEVLEAFEKLGQSPTARIDAREWHKHFRRRMRK